MNVRLPDGTIVNNVPDGTSQSELLATLKQHGHDISGIETHNAGTTGNFVEGAAHALAAPVRAGMEGLAKILPENMGNAIREAHATADKEEARQYDTNSTANQAGQVTGEIARTLPVGGVVGKLALKVAGASPMLAPALRPFAEAAQNFGLGATSAATNVGGAAAKIAAGATTGAVSSAMVNPSDAGTGAAVGAALPVLGAAGSYAGRAASGVVRPFFDAGQRTIAGRAIESSARDPAALTNALANPPKSVTPLTLAEVANDPGISALQRTMVNRSPDFAADHAARQSLQNVDRTNAFRGLAGDEGTIAQLSQDRQQGTAGMLALAQQNAGDVGTKGVLMGVKDTLASPSGQRRAIVSSLKAAAEPFQNADGKWALKLPFDKAWGARQNLDDIARGVSDKVDQRVASAAGRELADMRERLTTALTKASPDFATYSAKYAEMSKPIDAAKTLQDVFAKTQTGSTDMSGNVILSAAKLNVALGKLEPEQWAKMTTAQQEALKGLAEELSTAARVQTMGKAVGSNTAQNLGADSALVSTLGRSVTNSPIIRGTIGAAANALYSGSKKAIEGHLGNALLDPAVAAALMQHANSPVISAELQRLLSAAGSRGGGALPALGTSSRQER